jgi:uncharacterized membrane protein
MEALAIILLIVIIVLLLNHSGNITRQLSRLEGEINSLRSLVTKISIVKKEEPVLPVGKEQPKAAEEKKYFQTDIKPVEEKKEPVVPVVPQVTEEKKAVPISTVIVEETITVPTKKAYTPPPPSFSERNPDLEKFIGENLISKIGIAILVLAIGFFVKYAIDKDWIGSIGRVSIGILAGAILIALAHRFRNTYKGFSSVLAGGGLAVFYFTITLAFQQFQLFAQTSAFVIMIIITVFAVMLSLLYNRQELAVIALLGGFCSPFLVSNGNNNYVALFTYLLILNSGLLVIAYNKAWRTLNILSFLFTVIIFGGWLVFSADEQLGTWRNGLLFATAFHLLYFVINIAHNIKERKAFIASDFGILLVNTCLYFTAGIICLNNMQLTDMKGLFSASMGIFNLAASYFLFRKQKVDTNILYLLIGITLTFISITAPLQLHGNYITLFWASEALLLYWLFTKSRIRIIQYSSLIVWIAMLISLLMDWRIAYAPTYNSLPIIFNKAFITALFAAVATWLLFVLQHKESKEQQDDIYPGKNLLRICAILLLFSAGALEINYQFNFYFPASYLHVLYLLLYTVAFISILTFLTSRMELLKLPWRFMALMLSLCIGFYLLCLPPVFNVQQEILTSQKDNVHFLAHWITALLLASVIYRLIQLLRNNRSLLKNSFDTCAWIMCTVVVIFFSVEFHLLANTIFFAADNPLENIQRIYIKTGLPILWGLCSFCFMWLGMQHKYRTLRIISLTLFAVTLIKLFTYDISNIPVGGKIAAFFCLGVLLLVVSFMYQRLKKIIIEDEEKTV